MATSSRITITGITGTPTAYNLYWHTSDTLINTGLLTGSGDAGAVIASDFPIFIDIDSDHLDWVDNCITVRAENALDNTCTLTRTYCCLPPTTTTTTLTTPTTTLTTTTLTTTTLTTTTLTTTTTTTTLTTTTPTTTSTTTTTTTTLTTTTPTTTSTTTTLTTLTTTTTTVTTVTTSTTTADCCFDTDGTILTEILLTHGVAAGDLAGTCTVHSEFAAATGYNELQFIQQTGSVNVAGMECGGTVCMDPPSGVASANSCIIYIPAGTETHPGTGGATYASGVFGTINSVQPFSVTSTEAVYTNPNGACYRGTGIVNAGFITFVKIN